MKLAGLLILNEFLNKVLLLLFFLDSPLCNNLLYQILLDLQIVSFTVLKHVAWVHKNMLCGGDTFGLR